MFNVGNNLLTPPLGTFVPGALPGAATAPGYGASQMTVPGDSINPNATSPSSSPAAWPWFGGGNGAGGFITQFMSTIFAAFAQMAQYLTSTFGTPPWGTTPQPGLGSPPQNGPGVQGGPPSDAKQQFFTSAEFSSKGDPHDDFQGTLQGGQTVGGRWNNMMNHPNLLDSKSFAGGYRISTDVGQPNAHGVTRNDAATIETNYGRTSVTMKADGSYAVTDDGKNVQLQAGKAQDLGHGESVTLNADGSLTVVDRNGKGGEITATLTAKNGGVGVEASARNVDLGGYLVRHSEKMQSPTVGSGGGPQVSSGGPQVSSTPPWQLFGAPQPGVGSTPAYQAYQPYEPLPSYQPPTEVPSVESLLGA